MRAQPYKITDVSAVESSVADNVKIKKDTMNSPELAYGSKQEKNKQFLFTFLLLQLSQHVKHKMG